MNTWLLSILLLLVACGLLFRAREQFEDAEPLFDAEPIQRNSHSKYKQRHMPLTYSHDISIARELNTRPDMIEGFCDCAGRVEGFADSLSNRKGSEGFATCTSDESRHKCPVCPDMSKYIRLDEVPCWNCSLP
jgi:hypothetical protein